MKYIITIIFFAFAGCGLILDGSKAKVYVPDGSPPKASVYMNDSLLGITPMRFKVPKRDLGKDIIIQIKADGYETLSVEIYKNLNPAALFLDIICGVVWVFVDAGTGGWYDPDPKIVKYKLKAI